MPTDSSTPQLDPSGLLAGAVIDPCAIHADGLAARLRRRRQRLAAATIAFVLLVLIAVVMAQVGITGTPGSGGIAPKVAVKAESLGVLVLRPGEPAERVAPAQPIAGARDSATAAHASFGIDELVLVERAATSASVNDVRRSSTATARVEQISLIGGRVVISTATISAVAQSADGRAGGSLQLAPSTTLTVDGAKRAVTPNQRIAIEGVGTIIVNEQAVLAAAPTGDAQTGPRHRIVGAIAHLRITQATGGLASGSEVIIGRVDAAVREGKIVAIAHPESTKITPPPPPTVSLQPGTPRPGDSALPRSPVSVRSAPPGATLVGSLQGYVFPILGHSDYGDSWGAPRASTGVPHQGTDIFANEGTPLVAVADGVLDRVGWNTIGGYRLWLFDEYGNSFYYAHLSAFSPTAFDGARVRRGDVVGFVGQTGDAQGTPPHVHFEVHPGNGAAINPFPLLGAWKQGIAVAIGLVTTGVERVAPLALLGFTDITSSSGLQASVLDHVPDTTARTIDQENAPRPTDKALKGAIDGPGISR